jgi:glutamine synthetase
MYAEGHKVKGAPRLPLNLLDALRAFEKDRGLREALGAPFSDSYLKLKHQEWNAYASHFTQWERDTTLDV